MKATFKTLAALAVAALCTTVQAGDPPKVGEPIPKIQARELFNNEYNLNLEDLQGYIVVVEFWATWCGPCKASIPHLSEMQERYTDRGVVFIGLSDEKTDTVRKFLQSTKMKYLVGAESSTGRDFGVNAIPAAFLVDPDGVLRWKGHPMQGLDEQIDLLLAKYPPTRKLGKGPAFNEEILGEIESHLASGQIPDAVKKIGRLDQQALAAVAAHADRKNRALAQVEPIARAEMAAAKSQEQAGNYHAAIDAYRRIGKDYSILPISRQAHAEADRIERSQEFVSSQRSEQIERMASNSLKRALRLKESGQDKFAYLKFKSIVADYPNTEAALQAATMVAEYEADAAFMASLDG